MKKTHSNYQRLTVYLNNLEKKNKFQTTYTYKPTSSTPVTSIQDAVNVVLALHSETSDNATTIARKIKKVIYNGVEIQLFAANTQHTKNGWLVK